MKYVTDEQFKKMTKKEKLEMETTYDYDIEIQEAVYIPTAKKDDGWAVGAIFVYAENHWSKNQEYDCWKINNDMYNPIDLYKGTQIIGGDFEYGGIQIFNFPLQLKSSVKAVIGVCGAITLNKKH